MKKSWLFSDVCPSNFACGRREFDEERKVCSPIYFDLFGDFLTLHF